MKRTASRRSPNTTKLDTGQSSLSRQNDRLPNIQANATPQTAMNGSRELPMPHITHITSLSQAQATLLHCWTKLTKFNQEQTPTGSFAWSPSSVSNERHTFQTWLERWEVAFGAFLANAMASMSSEDITTSRVLKSNHLACTILASDTRTLQLAAFETEYRAIVELAGAVLRSRHITDSPQDTKTNAASMPSTRMIDVREPLLVVLSRCNQQAVRTRAHELLSTFYP